MKGRIEGLDTVMRNLNREIKRIKGASAAGLWDAGLQIQRASQKRVPVDTGHLKASHYTWSPSQFMRLVRGGDSSPPQGTVPKDNVEIGVDANYAVYVHENLEARHKVGQAKFLELAVADNQSGILEIIRRRAKIG